MPLAPSEKTAIASERGFAVFLLSVYRQSDVALGYRQPARRGLGEIPLDERPRSRALAYARRRAPERPAGRRGQKDRGSLQAAAAAFGRPLFALVEADAARQTGRGRRAATGQSAAAPCRSDSSASATRSIMIAEPPAEPAGTIEHRRFLDRAADHRRQSRFHGRRAYRPSAAGTAGHIGVRPARRPHSHLADRGTIWKTVREAADAAHDTWLVGGTYHGCDAAAGRDSTPSATLSDLADCRATRRHAA